MIMYDHVIRWMNSVLHRRRFYEVKFQNYVRASSAAKVIFISQVKSKEGLILPSLIS